MRNNNFSKFNWLLLAGIMLFMMSCSSLLPRNIPLTGLEPTHTTQPPFPSATNTQSLPTAVGAVTVVVTATPVPATNTPVPPTATQAPTSGGCSYQAAFIGDVTIPDETVLLANTAFVKTWRIRNDGTCAWGPGQKLDRLTFSGGNSMSGPAAVAIPQVVQPGGTVDVSVSLVAPAKPGYYVSEWMLQMTSGTFVGVGADRAQPLTTVIVVGVTPTPTKDPAACIYQVAFIADVTFPDNFVVAPGEYITKIWRVRNTGSCTWGPNGQGPKNIDRLIFTGGHPLGAPSYVMLPDDGIVAPGETFDMRVNMVMPAQPSVYRSEWMFGNANSAWLGVGGGSAAPLYAQVVVGDTTIPTPSVVTQIEFGPGATQTSFDVYVDPKTPLGYGLRVMGGQQMTILASGNVSVGVLDKNLSPLGMTKPSAGVWSARIPNTGDYTVVIYGGSGGDTSVTIKIPPL